MIFLLIVAVIVVIWVVRNSSKDDLATNEANRLAPEIVNRLQELRRFLKVNQFNRDFHVMLIPINRGSQRFAVNSCMVQISMRLYADEVRLLKAIDQLNTPESQQHFAKWFYFSADLQGQGTSIQGCSNQDCDYISYTYENFSAEYKRLMTALYPKITAAFPDIHWSGNGSVIIADKFHQ